MWILVVLLAAGFVALARQIGLLYRRLGQSGARIENTGLDLGQIVEPFVATDLFGNRVRVPWLGPQHTLLMFVAPFCSVCDQVAPAVKSISETEKGVVVVLVSFNGDADSNRAYAAKHAMSRVPYVLSPDLALRLHVLATPYAIVLDSTGVVRAKGLINSREHLDSLLNAIELNYDSVQTYRKIVLDQTASA
ncbi:MAG: methylamine dehydrogenase accessory protein MauD [Acidobacteriia bacterium]|nr:methylamine dehydrogenase accessory protein MauD [Terriglobia bacterium]